MLLLQLMDITQFPNTKKCLKLKGVYVAVGEPLQGIEGGLLDPIMSLGVKTIMSLGVKKEINLFYLRD